jgi:hypothetical protein
MCGSGKLFGFVSEDHNALTFVDLLDVVDTLLPDGRGHIICDNLSRARHRRRPRLARRPPALDRHFTPKHASWLNQIECMFGILDRRVFARGSFASKDDLTRQLYAYMLGTTRPLNPSTGPTGQNPGGHRQPRQDF